MVPKCRTYDSKVLTLSGLQEFNQKREIKKLGIAELTREHGGWAQIKPAPIRRAQSGRGD
jgi:hypothetical protein